MTFIEKLIKRFFPNKIITHRISDLIDQSLNQNIKINDICISIETDSHSRRFCYLNIDELTILYQNSPVLERSLYELISPISQVKAYVDFEYYLNNNLNIQNPKIGSTCCLKILHLLLNSHNNIISDENKYIDLVLKQFLVLEASTSEKISYHFIHTTPSVVFENNITLGLFIKVIIHFFLWSTALHKCSSFNINVILQNYSISALISLLAPHVNVLRTSCNECHVYSNYITVAEIAHLLVENKQNQYTLAIDLSVYSKNQQFRLFDCVKKNQENPLVRTNSFLTHEHSEPSYYEILKKSLVTYHDVTDVPILYLKDNQFVCKLTDTINSTICENYQIINLNNINTHYKTYFTSGSTSMNTSKSIKPNISTQVIIQNNTDQFQQYVQQFRPFVEKLIKSDTTHQGFIRSSVRGNRNSDIIFFNIGGEYRFCPRKGTHHQRNTTAILIDINNRTFSIRCKDPDCQNTILVWKNIE